MPSSTSWRTRSSILTHRVASPTRPDCERLSPEPLESSPTFKNYTSSARRSNTNGQPQGLGLSGTPLTNEDFEFAHPDHLYIDQHGGAHVGARIRSSNHQARNSTRNSRYTDVRPTGRPPKANRNKSHTRSGSTIDDLANAAIATSPTFTNGSPIYAFGSPTNSTTTRPATSYINGYNYDENSIDRPSKRVKSEKLHEMQWSPQHERPRTSHAYEYQSPRQEDAELLLTLTYGPSWVPHASPLLPPTTIFEKKAEIVVKEDTKPVDIVHETVAVGDTEASTEDGPDINMEQEDNASVAEEEVQTTEMHSDVATDQMQPPIHQTNIPQTDESPIPGNNDMIALKPESEHLPELTPAEQLQQGALTMPEEIEVTAPPAPKRPRKIRPEVQAEVCASCQRLQRDGNDEDTTTHWIGCEHCKKWYHAACAGFRDKVEARSVDKFYCRDCEPQHGKTSFVRKSSRARTAIDYAGLNQGVVKPSDDSTMHHYIQPIKDGRIKVLPDDFARIRPEVLTADFWENMDGMKRPFVVPACWNPRFGKRPITDEKELDTMEAQPWDEETFVHYDQNGAEVEKPTVTRVDKTLVDSGVSEHEEVIDCDQDYLDMVMPHDLTVRKVAELFGPQEPVPVIDVKSQETKGAFTLSDWAEYYELDGEKPIRNVISLEVSNSRLGRLIRRPRVVRDIDLEDYVWDHESRSTSNKRPVQFYCLMSVADSYTDFHIDFGGSSVYYHILKGVKTFFFIPPEDKYLKKYEEWCNSDVQNDTWLGDLCGGNVTRVDLHEGDTAFIPAGWIHSVWTPEDSLVIGGNFLTRLDYDLQLKVANIEKTTKVPLKFRYPFFQKVMWFALLKYLEEDPLPEEVLRDFHEDSDYRFLRANPIWHEIGDLANDAEPGEVYYNARAYPKSELKGLPALRDYLYRTARIYADLPVPDINKRQIDAVKSSIPRGYGDPMQLIKTFAVWCAWKLGNEPAPDWVHSDVGLALELMEREKAKKPEPFRVPPERVSARKASQAPLARATPPTDEVDGGGDDSGKKTRSGSKTSTLKIACEPCRKRRIKCRHKDGDISPNSTSPAAIRPRTYSNVSVDIPKLASTSPVLNASDQTPTMNGNTSDFSSTSDLAQAALASLHSQSSDPNQFMMNSVNGSASKKGRSKACEECRKSKRRCVHDEHGRVDPAKAAEPSKPRGSATKRMSRPSDESITKRVKLEGDIDPSLLDPAFSEMTQSMDLDSNIDPALMGDTYNIGPHSFHQHTDPQLFGSTQFHEMTDGQKPDIIMNGDSGFDHMHYTYTNQTDEINNLIDPDLESKVIVDVRQEPAPSLTAQVAHLRQSPEHDISYSPITVDGQPIESTESTDVDMMDVDNAIPSSRNLSRQPKPVDRYVPEDHRSRSASITTPLKIEHRASSSGIPEQTIEDIKQNRRSSSAMFHSATSEIKRRTSLDISTRPMSRGSTTESDMTADEKMARELQAAENGLRRRTSVRA